MKEASERSSDWARSSSLLGLIISDEGIKFYNIDTRAPDHCKDFGRTEETSARQCILSTMALTGEVFNCIVWTNLSKLWMISIVK